MLGTVVILAAALSVASGGIVGTGFYFGKPWQDDYQVDHCKYWGRDCGQPAADYYCQLRGYSKASSFGTADAQATRVLKEKIDWYGVCHKSVFTPCKAIVRLHCAR